jgi:hypothetical protein
MITRLAISESCHSRRRIIDRLEPRAATKTTTVSDSGIRGRSRGDGADEGDQEVDHGDALPDPI